MAVIKNKFDLIVEINKKDPLDKEADDNFSYYRASQFRAAFALNKIPLASVTLAAGRNVYGLQPAQIHRDANELKLMYPMKVYLTVSGKWDQISKDDWDKAGTQVVFDGYITGIGYSKMRGQLQVTLQAIHWLADMAFSSSLSAQSHPSNAADISFRSDYALDCSSQTFSVKALSAQGAFRNIVTVDAIADDLWGQALHPMFCCLTEQDLLQLGICPGGPANSQPNDQAQAALDRFESDPDLGTCGLPRKWSVPLRFNQGEVGTALAKGISKAIAVQQLQSYYSRTLWDKLIQEFAPAFKFAVVPLVSTALVVPFVPGLRSTWQKEISENDIENIDISAFIRRPLRGVGIYAGRELRVASRARDTTNFYGSLGAGGCYIPDLNASGMLLIQRAPAWLVNAPGAATSPSASMLGRKTIADGTQTFAKQPTSTALTPQPVASTAAALVEGLGVSQANVIQDTASLYDNVARWTYMAEVLRGRTGTVKTKFRMDIAPGSNVKVTTFGESFITQQLGSDALRAGLVGTVTRVVMSLDAENSSGNTIFQMAHLRSQEENQSDKTSVPVHPLYPIKEEQWTGAPLVDAFLFGENPNSGTDTDTDTADEGGDDDEPVE